MIRRGASYSKGVSQSKKREKMVKNHLKTIAAPKTWPVKRKEKTFILRPQSGPHSLKGAISLNLILIDLLNFSTKKKDFSGLTVSFK